MRDMPQLQQRKRILALTRDVIALLQDESTINSMRQVRDQVRCTCVLFWRTKLEATTSAA